MGADLLDVATHGLRQLVQRGQRTAVAGRQDGRREHRRERQVGGAEPVAGEVAAPVGDALREPGERGVDDRPLLRDAAGMELQPARRRAMSG